MTSVYMRRAHEEDIKSIVSIINNARYYLKEQGLSQWQSGYPNQDTIEEDLVLQSFQLFCCVSHASWIRRIGDNNCFDMIFGSNDFA